MGTKRDHFFIGSKSRQVYLFQPGIGHDAWTELCSNRPISSALIVTDFVWTNDSNGMLHASNIQFWPKRIILVIFSSLRPPGHSDSNSDVRFGRKTVWRFIWYHIWPFCANWPKMTTFFPCDPGFGRNARTGLFSHLSIRTAAGPKIHKILFEHSKTIPGICRVPTFSNFGQNG